MSKIWATIVGGLVENVVLSDSPLPNTQCVDITTTDPRPAIGWAYTDNEFSPPAGLFPDFNQEAQTVPNVPPSVELSEASGSLQLQIRDKKLWVGCISFNLPWAKQAIADFLDNNATHMAGIEAARLGLQYGDFFVSWDDCQKIRDFIAATGV
jgi:hypothetical protein